MAVIPLGGANINRDIMSLQIEDDEAEELKLKYGSAISPADDTTHKPITLRDGRTIAFEEFAGLVEARVEEIILNVMHQISLSKFDNGQLVGGLIITGGASHMKNIDKAFVRDTKFEKIRFVRNIRIPLRTPDYPGLNADGDCNAAIALIDKGEINCCGGDLGQPNLFADNEAEKEPELTPEEIAAAEAQRKAEEEAAARAAAAEAARIAEEERRRLEEEERQRRKRQDGMASRKPLAAWVTSSEIW